MKKQFKNKKIISIILSIILVVGVGVLSLNFKNSKRMKVEANVITKDGRGMKTTEEMQEKTNASMIGVKMNIKPVFQTGDAMGNILLENTSSNGNSYQMTIVVNENDEVYSSGLITKGTRIDEIKLDKKLNKGKYPAVAYFTAYDEEQNQKGKSGINIELNILN